MGRAVLRRRVPLVLAIAMVIIAVLAGKAWAVLESGHALRPQTGASTVGTGLLRSVPAVAIPDLGPLLVAEQRELARLQAAADALTAKIAAWNALVAQAVKLGRCEEPGSGWMGIDWTTDGYNQGQHFAGGLGINVDLYAAFTGGGYAAHDAPDVQIEAFGRIYAAIGPSKWGCDATP